jgi:hypothetical protein
LSKYSPPNLKQICWSDVQFSLWLRENEIPIVTTPEFKNYSPYHYGFDLTTISGVEQVRNSMSFHYVKDNWLREGIVSAYEMDPSKLENIN